MTFADLRLREGTILWTRDVPRRLFAPFDGNQHSGIEGDSLTAHAAVLRLDLLACQGPSFFEVGVYSRTNRRGGAHPYPSETHRSVGK
jgi:hypothetical protein